MTEERLIWLSGVSLMLGGLLATFGWILFAWFDPTHRAYDQPFWLPFNFLVIFGGFFIALGLPGLYASQAQQSGIIGLLGFFILFTGIVFAYIAVHSIETMTVPNVPRGMMIIVSFAAPSLLVGGLLTAYTLWRAGVYPPWLAVALVAAGLIGLLTQFIPLPAWFARNIATVAFTITMMVIGFHVTAYASR
jgi:hypothetical protein